MYLKSAISFKNSNTRRLLNAENIFTKSFKLCSKILWSCLIFFLIFLIRFYKIFIWLSVNLNWIWHILNWFRHFLNFILVNFNLILTYFNLILTYYEWTKFLLAIIYGTLRRHSNSSMTILGLAESYELYIL